MKRAFCVIFILVLMLPAFSCKNKKNGQSSAESGSISEQSGNSETSFEATLPAPKIDVSSMNFTPVNPPEAQEFKITKELRYKMFDYFAQGYTDIMPGDDFERPEDLEPDMMVKLGIAMTKPMRVTGTADFPLYTYDGFDVQATVYKYLNLQIPSFVNVRMYDYDFELNLLYTNDPIPQFLYFYKLNSLSVNSEGIYSASFDMYRTVIAKGAEYEQKLAEYKAGIIDADNPDEDSYAYAGTCDLQYTVMTDENGLEFFRYLSKTTEKP